MSWLGKVFGGAFGFLLGGPLGGILGAALGHQFDKGVAGLDAASGVSFEPGSQRRVQMAFFTATFSIMGHLAKADGKVSREEIDLAEAIIRNMELSLEMRQAAIRLFNEGKNPDFPLDDIVDQLRQECHRRTTLIRMFIEIQLQAAFADGALNPIEDRLLQYICTRLQFSKIDYQRLKANFQAQQRFSEYGEQRGRAARQKPPQIDDAYAVLGLQPSASDSEIKKAYRRLISQHHPDKLVSKGLPEEMIKLATEKTRQIRKAYELIREKRGMD
ncbi:MAG: co-chaperone DjlA [Methylococcaceae bacterium]|nr:co-chaperone DjlA [Methylococcaceae bacterium]